MDEILKIIKQEIKNANQLMRDENIKHEVTQQQSMMYRDKLEKLQWNIEKVAKEKESDSN